MLTNNGEATFETDLLVVGGGMAGLSAAAYAARNGLKVVLVERAPQLGGNAALSGGFFWTAQTYDDLRREIPLGDPDLGRVLTDDYESAVAWLESLDIEMSVLRTSSANPFGAGHLIDILGYLDRCRRLVVEADGVILLEADVQSLLLEEGTVTGGVVNDRDGKTTVHARWTFLASGGFQADPELRRRYIHPQAGEILLRSNPYSDGAGLRLGLSVGAATTSGMDGFYGHVIASPLTKEFLPSDYLRLAQSIYTPYGVIVDRNGHRFTDESLGHYFNAQAITRVPGARALLVADERVRRENATQAPVPGMETIDLPQEAAAAGANVASAKTLEQLGDAVTPWGFDGKTMATTVEDFNSTVTSAPERLQPGRRRNARPLDEPPYVAVEVQPAITFTHGGLKTDTEARVVDGSGTPIRGLLAGGADAAGAFNRGYAGGLALATVFGLRAVKTILSES